MKGESYSIKIIIDANPVELERRFDEWVSEEVSVIHGNPQVQFTQALQKFILSVVYSRKVKNEITTSAGEIIPEIPTTT